MESSMLIDKYRPKSFGDLSFNHDTNTILKHLAHADDLPHLIIEGKRGSGKKTRIHMFLQEKFGDIVIKNQKLEFQVSSNKKKETILHIRSSKYHYQFNPSIHGVYDKVILNKFINDTVTYQKLSKFPYRIIIIEDADRLTLEAQLSLRRTLETRIKRCRFIFLVNKENNMIDQLYSRCLTIRNASPTNNEIKLILETILEKESKKCTSIDDLIKSSNRDLNLAVHYLDKTLLTGSKFNLEKNADVKYKDIYAVVDLLFSGKNLDIIERIRNHIYTLLVNGIDPPIILELIFNRVLDKIPKTKQNLVYINNICKIANDRDDSLRKGSKAMYHLESFVLHVFREIKHLLLTKSKPKTRIKKISPEPTKDAQSAQTTQTQNSQAAQAAQVTQESQAVKTKNKIVLKRKNK